LLGVRLAGIVDDLQPAHAVRHRHHAQSPEARIGVRGEPGPLLVDRIDDGERALLEMLEQLQYEITRNPEDVVDVVRLKALDQVIGDPYRRGCGCSWLSGR